jgi:hypothetical protein
LPSPRQSATRRPDQRSRHRGIAGLERQRRAGDLVGFYAGGAGNTDGLPVTPDRCGPPARGPGPGTHRAARPCQGRADQM